MKVTLWESKKEEIEIEIEFPIYRKDDIEAADYRRIIIYTRIDQPDDKHMRGINILIDQNSRIEIEINNNYFFNERDTIEYNLGHGSRYASTKEEFDEAIKKAQTLLSSIYHPGYKVDIFEKVAKYEAIQRFLWNRAEQGNLLASTLAATMIRELGIESPEGDDPDSA